MVFLYCRHPDKSIICLRRDYNRPVWQFGFFFQQRRSRPSLLSAANNLAILLQWPLGKGPLPLTLSSYYSWGKGWSCKIETACRHSTALVRPGMGQEGDGGGGWAGRGHSGNGRSRQPPSNTQTHARAQQINFEESQLWLVGRTIGWTGKASPNSNKFPTPQFSSKRPVPSILSSRNCTEDYKKTKRTKNQIRRRRSDKLSEQN